MGTRTVDDATKSSRESAGSMMSRGIIIGIVIVVIGAFVIILSEDQPRTDRDTIFHITLADPEIYTNGIFVSDITLDAGRYAFEFVPSGSSPQQITIHLDGSEQSIRHEFELKGTLQNTGISEYYTWEYLGDDTFVISDLQEMTITIDPHGDTSGSVSVYIME